MKSRSPSPIAQVTRLIVLALLPLTTGCLYTSPMWQDANRPVVTEPQPVGILDAAPDRTPSLVVSYSISCGGDPLYATVPLAPEGRPVEPFGHPSNGRRPERVVAELTAAQRRQLADAKLTFHDAAWAKRLDANPHYRKLDDATDGLSNPRDITFEDADGALGSCGLQGGHVRAHALRLGRPWTHAEQSAMSPPAGAAAEFPKDACVVILPYTHPRPAGQRRAAQARAALLTPVTVLGDIVVVPWLWVGCYVFHSCP